MSEAGGHRWQRVPPTERKGRVHTSTVTVVVYEPNEQETKLDLSQVDLFTARGSGNGGQHRNKTDSCVTLIDRKTGVKVRIDGRSQHQNKRKAFGILEERLTLSANAEEAARVSKMKAEQAGSGMRGDKVRTYREQDDTVSDHRTEKKARLKDVLAGKLDKLR